MNRTFLIVVAAGVLVLGVAVLLLGAFPPSVTPHPIQKVLPNDSFKSR
jgi:hypothetical protein